MSHSILPPLKCPEGRNDPSVVFVCAAVGFGPAQRQRPISLVIPEVLKNALLPPICVCAGPAWLPNRRGHIGWSLRTMGAAHVRRLVAKGSLRRIV